MYFSSNKHEEHALKILKNHLDNSLSAEIHIKKQGIHFSVLRNFPNVGLQLDEILIKSSTKVNLEDFSFDAKDTLLFAEEVSLLFNLKSLITKKYELKKVVISGAKLHLLADKSGNFNYKIVKPSEGEEKPDSMIIQLKSINLNDTEIYYIDARQQLHYSAFITSSELSGEFSKEDFNIQAKTQMKNSELSLKGKDYLDKVPAKLSLAIRKSEDLYYFEKGLANIFGVNLAIEGTYDKINKHYKFIAGSKSTSVSNISYPALEKFLRRSKLQIEKGSLDQTTNISGYAGNFGSSITTDFVIQKAGLKSKERSIQIKNIFLKGQYFHDNKGVNSIRIDTLLMYSDKSQIYGNCSITNLDHPFISGNINGILELKKLMIVKTIASRFVLDGTIQGQLIMKGKVSKEPELWRTSLMSAFKNGELEIENGFVRPILNSLPGAYIDGIIKLKGLSDVWLENVNLRTGDSDLIINGSVTDLPLFSGDRSIFPVYRCNVSSNEFHVEDFFIGGKQQNTEEKRIVQLPDSMVVFAEIKVGEFHFGKFSAANAKGTIHYQPKVLTINNFSLKSQKGEIFSEIQITQQKNRLKTKSSTNFQKVDLGDMFTAFNNFGQDVIHADNLDGLLTGTAEVEADWDFQLKSIQENLKVQSDFIIQNGELIDYQPLLGLSRFIEVEELNHIKFDKLETNIQIEDRVALISETNINSSAISLIFSGWHDFDNRYKYHIQVQLSDILWKKAKRRKPENTEFGYVVDDGLGKTTIPMVIVGKDKDFEVTYDKKKSSSDFRAKVKEEKDELKRLFESEDNEEKVKEEQNIRIQWEDDEVESEQSSPDDDGENNKEDEDQEFLIEWEDE